MHRYELDERGVRVACGGCGAKNRLAYARLAQQGQCAHCHAPLAPPDEPIPVPSAAAFDAATTTCALPIVVDFWATWCGPCRTVAPELEKVAQRAAGRRLVLKVDTEALPGLAQRFGIRSIPTLAVLAGGREVTRTSGAMPATQIEKWMDGALG